MRRTATIGQQLLHLAGLQDVSCQKRYLEIQGLYAEDYFAVNFEHFGVFLLIKKNGCSIDFLNDLQLFEFEAETEDEAGVQELVQPH